MVDQTLTFFFNKIYDDTYKKTFLYVVKKCSNADDISDILQDIYTEVFSVIVKKNMEYIENPEAFVMKIAKSKIFKHYSSREKLKVLLPMFYKNEDEEEINLIDEEITNDTLFDELENKQLLTDISQFLSSKPTDIRKIFYLYYYLDLTILQISEELSIKESSVKNKLFRTLKEIRKLYGRDGEQYE